MSKRVVITGVGLVTPLGTGVEKSWENLCAGKSGIAEITKFDASDFQTRIAGEVTDFDPAEFLSKKEARRTPPFIGYAVAATRMALENSGFIINEKNGGRVAVVTGCGLGGLQIMESNMRILDTRGPRRVSPFFIPMLIGNMAPGMISIQFGARGPNLSIATACAAGTHAVGEAYKMVKHGVADAAITGGMEAVITRSCVSGFNAMKALSNRNDDPEAASRPFDRDRDGFVPGEGSGIMLIEPLESALARDADIYAEIAGFGMSGDGHHMSAPAPEGEGMARCMQAALDDAGLGYRDIDHINAHGTSTPMNDLCETRAIKTVFNTHAKNIPISATKSMTGHLLGGAGGIETVFTALSIRRGMLPPTINLENPDEECDLDYVPLKSRNVPIKTALSNSFGFGGTNACLILKKVN